MNWHQQKAELERRAPVLYHPTRWTHVEDQPHRTTSVMRFDTAKQAEAYLEKVNFGYLLPPQVV